MKWNSTRKKYDVCSCAVARATGGPGRGGAAHAFEPRFKSRRHINVVNQLAGRNARHRHDNLALFSELDGIANDVYQHLSQLAVAGVGVTLWNNKNKE